MALVLLCASAGLQAAPQRYTQNGVQYLVGPAGTWVQRTPVSGAPSPRGTVDGALRYRLIDAQLLLTDAVPQRYVHRTIQVVAPAGLEQAARVDITFQPQYETLTLHSIAVLRGPARTEKLPRLRPELLRRELGLEAGLYDGATTASFTVDDVRVGDSIEVEYTLAGINPALDGRYSRFLSLAVPAPLDLYKLRVLADPRRPVQVRAVGSSAKVKVSQQGRYKQWQLQLENLAATRPEEHAPAGAAALPRLEVSEFTEWADVARWADGLYRVPEGLSPELRATIAELGTGNRDERQAVRRALKFVQDQVRYVGVEIGEGSLRPSHPDDVFRRRYGDCKDKAVLLSAILRGLGVQAHPALVSTWAGRAASDWMPMPTLFDHMIVRVEVDGQTYWLDATRSHQESGLDQIGMTPFQWALVTGVGATRLAQVQLPSSYRQGVDTRYEYTVTDYRGPVALKATVTFTGALAEGARGAIASAGTERLGDELFADVHRVHPGATPVGTPEVRDETEENRFNVTQAFAVPELFVAQGGDLRAELVAVAVHDLAQPPSKLQRSLPLALPYPFAMTASIDVRLPDDLPIGALTPVRVDDGNVEFTISKSYAPHRLQLRYAVVYKRDAVAASDVVAYARTLRDIRSKAGYQFSINKGVELARRRAVESRQLLGSLDRAVVADVGAGIDREQEAAVQSLSGQIAAGMRGTELAQALVSRAIAYSNMERLSQALQDLARAVQADPALPVAYLTRGQVYTKLGRYDEALADFERAGKLDPESAALARSRGHARFLRGDFRAAQADFRRAVELSRDEDQLHALIWLYFASARLGGDARAVVEAVPADADPSQWPGPALMLLLGQATPEEMLAGAWSFDRKAEVLNLCEAYFFLGQYRLLAGDRDGARRAFQDAVATGAKHYLEYSSSKIELGRLATPAGKTAQNAR
jgi:lipoprotein NlpI